MESYGAPTWRGRTQWPIWAASLAGGDIVYARASSPEADYSPRLDRRLLDRFLRTADDPTRTLAFARRHGRLGLCRHVRPDHHPGADSGCGISADPVPEPLAAWWYWARRARAILDLAAEMKGSYGSGHGAAAARALIADVPPWEDAAMSAVLAPWRDLWLRPPRPGVAPAVRLRRRWPGLLEGALNGWADETGLVYHIAWMADGPEGEPVYHDVASLIGRLLIDAVRADWPDVHVPDERVCVACGSSFVRWQRGGSARYCRSCVAQDIPRKRAEAARQARRKRGVTPLLRGRAVQQARERRNGRSPSA